MADPLEELRALAAAGHAPRPLLLPYLDKVRRRAYAITDRDVAELKAAGASEDQIFEATIAAATEEGLRRLDSLARCRTTRLSVVDQGHAPGEAALLEIIRKRSGQEPIGVLKTLYYRPEIFGRPFSAALDQAMRGPSDWSDGDRELFAAFVSSLNQCPF